MLRRCIVASCTDLPQQPVFCSQPKASAKSRKPALFSYEKLKAESQLYKNLFGISSAAAKFFGFSFSFFTFFQKMN